MFNLRKSLIISKRDYCSYFAKLSTFAFILIFLFLSGIPNFYIKHFFKDFDADNLKCFFSICPWMFLLIIPTIAIKPWIDERNNGIEEFLKSFPITASEIVIGKFIAASFFIITCLIMTMSLWAGLNITTSPDASSLDNGVILSRYIACLLVIMPFIAMCLCLSYIIHSPIKVLMISFIIYIFSIVIGTEWFIHSFTKSDLLQNLIRNFSVMPNFVNMTNGIIEPHSIIFFISLTAFWIFTNSAIINYQRSL